MSVLLLTQSTAYNIALQKCRLTNNQSAFVILFIYSKPVIVGVDNRPGTPSSKNADGKTDHFITIDGTGQDSQGKYLTFYDNATNLTSKGCSSNNKLYYNENTGIITGFSAANGDDVLTKLTNGELRYLKPVLSPSQDPNFWGANGVNNPLTATHGITNSTQLTPTNQ